MGRLRVDDADPVEKPETDQGVIAAALAKLAEIAQSQTQQTAIIAKQNAPKNNENGPDTSVFNPRGEKDFPMPKLKCDIFAPYKLDRHGNHGLTREEVELFNLLEPGEFVIEGLDGAPIKVAVRAVKNASTDKLEKLFLDTLWDEEHFRTMPPARKWLREVYPKASASIMTMAEENRQIREGLLPISVGE